MLRKTFKFPIEVGIILDRVIRIRDTVLKTLGSADGILNKYAIYHLCVILKNRVKPHCKNETEIKELEYETLASLDHVLDTFSTEDTDDFFDLLESGNYSTFHILGYENIIGYTNVTVVFE